MRGIRAINPSDQVWRESQRGLMNGRDVVEDLDVVIWIDLIICTMCNGSEKRLGKGRY